MGKSSLRSARWLLAAFGTVAAIGFVLAYPSPHARAAPGSGYQSLSPGRLLDSRPDGQTIDGAFAKIGLRTAGSTTELQVAARGGVASDADAVVLNVTVTEAEGPGFVTVWPCGQTRPNASSLNYSTASTIPNAVIAKIGTGGKVCLCVSNTTHLIADVNGYYPPASGYQSLSPGRLLDSRPDGQTIDGAFAKIGLRTAGSTTELQVAARGGVASDADAVVLNVTVTEAEGPGFVTVWPCGQTRPNASSLNYSTASTIPNAVIAKIGTGGKVCLYVSNTTHLIADVNGYYPPASGYQSLSPGRLLDSRPDGQTIDGAFAKIGLRTAGSTTELQVAARGGVASDADAVVLNVTVTEAEGPGFVTVWPCGQTRPNASSLNYSTASTIPNAVIAKIGTGGKVCLYVSNTTHLIADVNGYSVVAQHASVPLPAELVGTWSVTDCLNLSCSEGAGEDYVFSADGRYEYTLWWCHSPTNCEILTHEFGNVQATNGVLALDPQTAPNDGPRSWPYEVTTDPIVGDTQLQLTLPSGQLAIYYLG